jgi:methyl-accepting chemotaxis protein
MFRFGISAKFLTAFTLLLAVMAGMGLFAIDKIGEVNGLSLEMRNRWLPASQIIGDIHAYTSQYRIKQSEHIAGATPEAKQRAEKLMRNAQAAIDGMLKDYQPLLESREQKALFTSLKTDWAKYTQSSETLIRLSNTGDPTATDTFNGEALDSFYAVEDDILQLIDLNGKGATALSTRSDKIYTEARKFTVGAVGTGLAMAIALLLLLMRTVARPISKMSVAVGRLVEGDLAVDVPGVRRKDELGSLARALDGFKELFTADQKRAQMEIERARDAQLTIDAIGGGLTALAEGNLTYRVDENGQGALAKLHVDYNEAVARLAGVLGHIVDGCHTIKSGTSEIASASSDLSRRTERQAESLAHASRTLSEFTGTVKVAADNARQTSSRLGIARQSAENVDDTAKKAIIAMRHIEASSKEMTDIITIDGIAFQTNLLALNAGVEAARAGQSGAGFAVVAQEVRNLAQRSAEAAASIRKLVMTSGAQINEGVSLVESSGDALRQIVSEVASVCELVDEIAEAAQKQASGIAEISGMVTSMDEATQQNAAMVEESSASTRNLSDETGRLVEQLGTFRLARQQGVAAASSRWTSAPAFHGNAAVKVDEDDWASF